MINRDIKINCYNDGVVVGSLPTKIVNYFRACNFVSGDGETKSISYNGLIFLEDQTCLFLPKTFDYEGQDLKQLAKLIVNTLYVFLKRNTEGYLQLVFNKQDYSSLNRVNIYKSFLDDYATRGRVVWEVNNRTRSGSGKIDWKSTIHGCTPLYTRHGVPVYDRPIVLRREEDSLSLFNLIHKWLVSLIDYQFGWIFSDTSYGLLFPELNNIHKAPPCTPSHAIYYLRKTLTTQYDQRIIWIINTMLTILEEIKEVNLTLSRGYFFGISNFWPVWEDICRSSLSKFKAYNQGAIPQPAYFLADGVPISGKYQPSQRPDIVIEVKESQVMVLDAKYYDVEKSVPGWGDIVKQIYYAESISKSSGEIIALNGFIFPEPKEKIHQPHVACVQKSDKSKIFPEVTCHYFNLQEALKCYINKYKHDNIIHDYFSKVIDT